MIWLGSRDLQLKTFLRRRRPTLSERRGFPGVETRRFSTMGALGWAFYVWWWRYFGDLWFGALEKLKIVKNHGRRVKFRDLNRPGVSRVVKLSGSVGFG